MVENTMIEERNTTWIIYPEYFDIRFSRRLGRKVPLNLCIDSPTLDEVLEATRKAGLRVIRIERDKRHPANWIESRGRIIVLKDNKTSKRATLIKLAKYIKLVRKKSLEKKKIEAAKKKRKKDIDKYLERILKTKKKKSSSK